MKTQTYLPKGVEETLELVERGQCDYEALASAYVDGMAMDLELNGHDSVYRDMAMGVCERDVAQAVNELKEMHPELLERIPSEDRSEFFDCLMGCRHRIGDHI